jgi:hypothetical protein
MFNSNEVRFCPKALLQRVRNIKSGIIFVILYHLQRLSQITHNVIV